MNRSTREVSSKQEKAIAKVIGGKRTANSRSYSF